MDQLAGGFARFQQVREANPCSLTQRAGVGTWFRYAEVLQVLTQTIRFASVETEAEVSPGSTNVMALDPPPSYLYRDPSPAE